MEIDAQKVIDRLRSKLSEKDWEITLLEVQILELQEKAAGQDGEAGEVS